MHVRVRGVRVRVVARALDPHRLTAVQSKEKRPLFERVAALLTHKIGHQKEYAKDVSRDESLRALRSVLARLRRTTATGPLLNPLVAAVHFVIKVRCL